MSLSEYQDTHSWQGAINLGPHLVKLAEQLPATEQNGLSQQIRLLMIELPGAIAEDLLGGGQSRVPVVLRLSACLELIERIYPALDGAAAKSALDELAGRLNGNNFAEKTNSSAVAAPPVAPSPPAALPPNALAEGATADLPNEGETASPAANNSQEPYTVHVQPDSGQ